MAGRIYVRAALARNFTRFVDTIKAIGGGFPAGPDSRHTSDSVRAEASSSYLVEHTTNPPAFGICLYQGDTVFYVHKRQPTLSRDRGEK